MQWWHGAGPSWHGAGPFLNCSYNWARGDNIFPYLGGYISATVIFLTIVATYRSARSIKMSDNFIAFTNAFNALMKERLELTELPTELPPNPAPGQTVLTDAQREARAKDYFGRFYGFVFSEYYAYREGTLHRRVFTLWIQSRWREFHPDAGAAPDLLQGVGFQQGWTHWHQNFHRNAEDDYTRLMRRIQQCAKHHVPSAVRWYGPWSQWFRWFFFAPLALVSHFLLTIWEAVWTRRDDASEAIRRWFAAARNGLARSWHWLTQVAWASLRQRIAFLWETTSNAIHAAWHATPHG
jgi:hypothetical protein